MKTPFTLSCLLIDDEPHATGLLQTLLSEHCPSVSVAGIAYTVEEGWDTINRTQPDLIFLDIQLHQQTGFDLLKRFTSIPFDIIFTTAYNQYAVQAFDYGALHYLMKPINVDKLEEAVKRVTEQKALVSNSKEDQLSMVAQYLDTRQIDKIALPNQHGFQLVFLNTITHCVASGSYTEFHLKDQEPILVSRPIGYYEQLLASNAFCRTHKKYLVNLQEVMVWEKGKTATLQLSNGSRVEVSPKHKTKLLELLSRSTQFNPHTNS